MALRNECGMNLHRPVGAVELSADARANVARIEEIWIECRERYGKSGPFLFGAFGAADAMFAPVVHRFRTYAIPVAPAAAAYMETMMALPAFRGMDPRGARRNPRDREVRDGVRHGTAAEQVPVRAVGPGFQCRRWQRSGRLSPEPANWQLSH